MSVEAEFTRFCGTNVRYVSHETPHSRTLRIHFEIVNVPGEAARKQVISGYLANGLALTLKRLVRKMADRARLLAYNATGQRAADMAQLLKGKTV